MRRQHHAILVTTWLLAVASGTVVAGQAAQPAGLDKGTLLIAGGADCAVGPVPSYPLLDLGFGVEIVQRLRINGGITNLFDHQYFTKRPTFYPGPGVWSSEGRSVQLSADLKW